MIDGNYVPTDEQFARAYAGCATVTFGDGTGRWASTQLVAHGASCAYGRARAWLERTCVQHPSGSDHWQRRRSSAPRRRPPRSGGRPTTT